MRSAKLILAAWGLCLVAARPAFGWGETGHRIVADIADKYITPQTRAAVKHLLHEQTLAEVANYADNYRIYHTNTAPWHFVDIPLSATSYDVQRDCTAHQGCLLAQLEIFKKQLADKNESDSNRIFALKFVVHLVGDLHQPLHCEDNDDRGGNSVKVSFFGEAKKSPTSSTHWNLHSVWDDGLIKHAGLSEPDYVSALTTNLTSAAIQKLQVGTTIGWAMQSHAAAQIAYQIPSDHDLGQAYYLKAKPVVDAALLKGGVRLARVLNETLGK